jgi:CDGSH-type Zn-finger protein
VLAADGSEYQVDRSTIALCRCGGSTNKPFCDGTGLLHVRLTVVVTD